jgi:hypothetical protein
MSGDVVLRYASYARARCPVTELSGAEASAHKKRRPRRTSGAELARVALDDTSNRGHPQCTRPPRSALFLVRRLPAAWVPRTPLLVVQ